MNDELCERALAMLQDPQMSYLDVALMLGVSRQTVWRKCKDHVPPRQRFDPEVRRRAVALLRKSSRSFDEVAKAVGVPRSTVKWWGHLALVPYRDRGPTVKQLRAAAVDVFRGGKTVAEAARRHHVAETTLRRHLPRFAELAR